MKRAAVRTLPRAYGWLRQISNHSKFRPLPRPVDSPLFSVAKPLTSEALRDISRQLEKHTPINTASILNRRVPKASILIGLCNVDGVSGVLLEVRAKLRTHSGEISLPGGKVEKTDANLVDAALRETYEEIGVHPSQVEILGELAPPAISLMGLTVHCFVGFIHPYKETASKALKNTIPDSHPISPPSFSGPRTPLPSLAFSSLSPHPSEVQQIIHFPLSHLLSPSRLRSHNIPTRPPYWAIDVTDFIRPELRDFLPTTPWFPDGDDIVPGGGLEAHKIEVWGLTAHYINVLMRRLEML